MSRNLFKSLLIPVFVSTCSMSFCQENYLQGYVIQNGDTLQGFIDYRNWRVNPEIISFKRDLAGDKSLFRPLDVEEFAIQGERYMSAIVQTDISAEPFSTPGTEGSPAPLLVTDTVFLQTLIWGAKSLYYFVNDVHRDQFYIGSGETEYVLLTYRKYLLTVDGTTGVFESNLYRGQLVAYLQDCPAIQNSVKKTRYDQRSLERIFRVYYDCAGSGPKFQKKTEKTIFDLGVVAGASLTSLKVTGMFYLEEADMPSTFGVPAALYVDIVLGRNQRKWSIYNELAYTSYKVNGTYREYPNKTNSTVYRSALGLSYIKLNNTVRFKYPIGGFFGFVNAGISNGFSIGETNSLVREITSDSGGRVEHEKLFTEMRKYEQGYLVGLGAKKGRLSIEARMEKGNGMSDFARVGAVTTRYSFLVGYRMN